MLVDALPDCSQRQARSEPTKRHPRAHLLRFVAIEVATLLLALAASTTLATVYLLVRTDRGLLGPSSADAAIAFALVAAVIPAWTAWRSRFPRNQSPLIAASPSGRSPSQTGEKPFAIRSSESPQRDAPLGRALAFALHPRSIPAWLWLAALLALLEVMPAVETIVVVTVFVSVVALASLLLLLIDPAARPLHARVRGMHLRRSP